MLTLFRCDQCGRLRQQWVLAHPEPNWHTWLRCLACQQSPTDVDVLMGGLGVQDLPL